MDEKQADAVAAAILAPDLRAQEDIRHKRALEAQLPASQRRQTIFVLSGFAVGAAIGYFGFGGISYFAISGAFVGFLVARLTMDRAAQQFMRIALDRFVKRCRSCCTLPFQAEPASSPQDPGTIPDIDWARLRVRVPDDQESFWWVYSLGDEIRIQAPLRSAKPLSKEPGVSFHCCRPRATPPSL